MPKMAVEIRSATVPTIKVMCVSFEWWLTNRVIACLRVDECLIDSEPTTRSFNNLEQDVSSC